MTTPRRAWLATDMTTVPLHDPHSDPGQPGPTASQPEEPARQAAEPTLDGPHDIALEAAAAAAPARGPTGLAPAAGGPAGPRLEAHVGAQYLLPLLSGGEARGLPGVVVTQVFFQRAGLGHPMDDVVVTGFDQAGHPATLEIQAKRSGNFTASDEDFRKVVAMAARAAAKPEFKSTRYELAVAIARTSTKVERVAQEALRWARTSTDAADFFSRLDQPGSGGAVLRRDFVEVFRTHLVSASAPSSDEALWAILRRFQILLFDCEQPGSLSSLMARERCALLLAPGEQGNSGALWTALENEALSLDSAAGRTDRATLKERLTSELGFKLGGDRGLLLARRALSSRTKDRMEAIDTTLGGRRLIRAELVKAAREALDAGGCVELRGAGGVGKSAVLRALAEEIGRECTALVVAPGSLPEGGWGAFAQVLGCNVSCQEFLRDLAGDGGGILFVDGLDGFDSPRERVTVADLLRAALQTPGVKVVATVRSEFDVEARAWLPESVQQAFAAQVPVLVGELTSTEVDELRAADQLLAPLLRDDHPARALSRNLYRLRRLRATVAAGGKPLATEVQMARQWWQTGDLAEEPDRTLRRRVLREMAVQTLTSPGAADTSEQPGEVLAGLCRSATIRQARIDRYDFAHDVLRDWAVACLLADEAERWQQLDWKAPAPMRLVRAVELAARIGLEEGADAEGWKAMLQQSAQTGGHGSWRRTLLLAPVRSEAPTPLLERAWAVASANDGVVFSDMIRAAITSDSEHGASMLERNGGAPLMVSADVVSPRGQSWGVLLVWALQRPDLPDGAIPALIDLFGRWSLSHGGVDPLTPMLVAKAHEWIQRVELRAWRPPTAEGLAETSWGVQERLTLSDADEHNLRTFFWTWCRTQPSLAGAEMRAMRGRADLHRRVEEMYAYIGSAAQADPAGLCELYQFAMIGEASEAGLRHRRATGHAFGRYDSVYFPPSPQNRPFLDLLRADAQQGLRLVRSIVDWAVRVLGHADPSKTDGIELDLDGERWSFRDVWSYELARGQQSAVAASALMALEAWAHERVEAGEAINGVIRDVLGCTSSPAAFLQVAVDVVLSHVEAADGLLLPFLASSRLLAADAQRLVHDKTEHTGLGLWGAHVEPVGKPQRKDLQQRMSRRLALFELLQWRTLPRDEAEHVWVRDRLYEAVAANKAAGRLPDRADWTYEPFAALAAANAVDRRNYTEVDPPAGGPIGQRAWNYTPPPELQILLNAQEARAADARNELSVHAMLTEAIAKESTPVETLQLAVGFVEADPMVTRFDSHGWPVSNRTMAASLVLRDADDGALAGLRTLARAHVELALLNVGPRRRRAISQTLHEVHAATIGLVADARRHPGAETHERLLELASRADVNLPGVLLMDGEQGQGLPADLMAALIRTGLTAAVEQQRPERPTAVDGDWAGAEDRYRERVKANGLLQDQRQAEHRRAELTWLAGNGAEPSLPPIPPPLPKRGSSRWVPLKDPLAKQDEAADPPGDNANHANAAEDCDGTRLRHDLAAPWLDLACAVLAKDDPQKLASLLQHFGTWSMLANGSDCGPTEEPGEEPTDWNPAYYGGLAKAVAYGADPQVLIDAVIGVQDQRFLGISAHVLGTLDALWLDGIAGNEGLVKQVRAAALERLMRIPAWMSHVRSPSRTCPHELSVCIAAVFLSARAPLVGTASLVDEERSKKAYGLLPMLQPVAAHGAASWWVATSWLGLLDVRPLLSNAGYLLEAVQGWFAANGSSSDFWGGMDMGGKVCRWIERALAEHDGPIDGATLGHLDGIVDTLLQCGLPAARLVEERLNELERHPR